MNISKKEFFESKEKALEFIKANFVGLGEVKIELTEGVVNRSFILKICNEKNNICASGFFTPDNVELSGDPEATYRLNDNFWQTIYPEQFKIIQAIESSGGYEHKLIYGNLFNEEQYITTIKEQIVAGNKGLQDTHILPDGNLDNWHNRSISIQLYLSYFGFSTINSFKNNLDKINKLINK